MNEIVLSLLAWLTVNSDYRLIEHPPRVTVVAEAADVVEYARTIGLDGPHGIAGMVYDCRRERVMLTRSQAARITAGQDRMLSALVYELAHHAQCLAAKRRGAALGQCRMEDEAYELQFKFLRQTGHEKDADDLKGLVADRRRC